MPNTETNQDLLDANNSNTNPNISISQKIDNKVYFPGNEINLSITCTNNSSELVTSLFIQDIIPKDVLVDKVTTNKGLVSQENNIVSVLIDDIKPNETVKIDITGKIEGQ